MRASLSAPRSLCWCCVQAFGVSSKNPLLKNITDYLIEEASAEEEELLGGAAADRDEGADAEDPNAPAGTSHEKDDTLIKVAKQRYSARLLVPSTVSLSPELESSAATGLLASDWWSESVCVCPPREGQGRDSIAYAPSSGSHEKRDCGKRGMRLPGSSDVSS